MSKTKLFGLIILSAFFVSTGCGKLVNKAGIPTGSIREITAVYVKPEKVTAGMEFDTAGSPCWYNGELLFTNNNFEPADNSRTYLMDKSGKISLIRDKNGVTTSIKPTGKGTFYVCEMIGHRVVEMDRTGKILRVVADKYNGKRLDGPNDMVIDKKGGIYLTDARFSPGQELVQDKPGVYYIKPDGAITRIIDDIEFPNGIGLSPDGKTLYVANTRGEKTKGRYALAYDVKSDGSVTKGRNFCEVRLTDADVKDPEGFGGGDGLAVDSAGNVYIATTRGLDIQVFNKEGKYLGNIDFPAVTNNMGFGGPDMKTMYVSAKDGIYKLSMQIPGR